MVSRKEFFAKDMHMGALYVVFLLTEILSYTSCFPRNSRSTDLTITNEGKKDREKDEQAE